MDSEVTFREHDMHLALANEPERGSISAVPVVRMQTNRELRQLHRLASLSFSRGSRHFASISSAESLSGAIA